MIKNIGVIGVGKLGLSFALLCASRGYNVYGSDTNREYVDRLFDRTYTTTEPGVNQLLRECGTFYPSYDNRHVVNSADIIFLFVPTPSKENGEYDHQYIEQAIEDIQDMDLAGKILVIGCTTMPGYTQSLIDRLEETKGITIVYNPEFIAQGDIINGLKKADMVLVGCHDAHTAYVVLGRVYANIMDIPLNMKVMSPTAAEITKISVNCYLAMKISYANTIGQLAIRSGLTDEVSTILQAIGDDSRIGRKYLQYGFGYGGPCIPRDGKALSHYIHSRGMKSLIPEAVDNVNDYHSEFLCAYYTGQNMDRKVPFIFPHLSYKKGTDMIVESQQIRLADMLVADGYTVYTTDTVKTHIPQLPAGVTGYTISI